MQYIHTKLQVSMMNMSGVMGGTNSDDGRTDWRTDWRTGRFHVTEHIYVWLVIYSYKISSISDEYVRRYGCDRFGWWTDGLTHWLTAWEVSCYSKHIHMASTICIQNIKCLWWICTEIWVEQIRMRDGRTDWRTDWRTGRFLFTAHVYIWLVLYAYKISIVYDKYVRRYG